MTSPLDDRRGRDDDGDGPMMATGGSRPLWLNGMFGGPKREDPGLLHTTPALPSSPERTPAEVITDDFCQEPARSRR